MSNSEPSAIALQGIPCICGLYKFRFEWRKRFAQGSPRFTLSRSRMRSRTGQASPVENQACGIAEYPRLRVHRHEARVTPAKRRNVYETMLTVCRRLGLCPGERSPPRRVDDYIPPG